jgi:HMG (high mobility group) box
MSAFLSYSNSKRKQVKAQNPEIGNAEVSRILAKMWREAPEEERKLHIEQEFGLRQEYKSAIAVWRQNADQELRAARKQREDIALQRLDASVEQNYNAALPAAASSDLRGNTHPQPQHMPSNIQKEAERDVVHSDGRSKNPSKGAKVPATALYPHCLRAYGTGYPPPTAGVDDVKGMPPPSGMGLPHGHFRGMPPPSACVGPNGDTSRPYGTMMSVNTYSAAEVYGSAEYGAPQNGCGE